MPAWTSTRNEAFRRCRVILLLGLSACLSKSTSKSATLTVYAASSLTDVFAALEVQFEQENPGIDVRFSFAGSQTLRTQIEAGARADVFASADESHVQALRRAGVVTRQDTFAANELALIVPAENPAALKEFRDLSRPLRLVVGAPHVPIGMYTARLLEGAERYGSEEYGLTGFGKLLKKNIVSEESNVRLVRAKISLGEADAAIVYSTDANASRVRRIPIPPELNQSVSYFMALIDSAQGGLVASRWVDFVRSARGRRVLSEHGFSTEGHP